MKGPFNPRNVCRNCSAGVSPAYSSLIFNTPAAGWKRTLRFFHTVSVAHGIDDGIDPHLVGIRGILRRISGKIGPFPGVSQVGIPVNDYHKPAVLIKNTATMGDVAVLFVSYAIVQGVADVRYLENLGNVVVAMKDFMGRGNLDDVGPRKDTLDGFPKPLRLGAAPEIVAEEKPAALQVLPECAHLFLGQVHMPRLDRTNERIAEYLRIGKWDGLPFVGDSDIGQPLDAKDELAVGLGPVRVPALVVSPGTSSRVNGPNE